MIMRFADGLTKAPERKMRKKDAELLRELVRRRNQLRAEIAHADDLRPTREKGIAMNTTVDITDEVLRIQKSEIDKLSRRIAEIQK